MKRTLLILSFTFLFFFLFMPKDTYALEIYNLSPNTISYWSTNTSSITGSVSKVSLYNTWYYTYNFSSSETKVGISFNYPNYSSINNKIGSADFVIYSQKLEISDLNPFRVYVKDYDNNITTCEVRSSKPQVSGSSNIVSNINTVHCDNFFVSSNFQVFIQDYLGNVSGIVGISNLTVKVNDISADIKDNTTSTEETNDKLDDLNDNITDSDTSESQSSASSFFDDFKSDDYGLSDIITMPLTFIKGLSNASCYSLDLPFPFVEQNVQIPCMTSIYENYFGSFLTLYQTITTGFIAYWVCVNIYRLVKNFKNPDDDKVEVMEL